MKNKTITEKQLLLDLEADVRLIINYKQDEQSLELLRKSLRGG